MTTFPRTAPRRAPRTLRPLLALGAALPLVLALTAASVHAQTTTTSAVPNGRLLASNSASSATAPTAKAPALTSWQASPPAASTAT